MKKIKIFVSLFLILFFINVAYATIDVPKIIKAGIFLDVTDAVIACDKTYNIRTKEKNLELSAGKVDIKLNEGVVATVTVMVMPN